MKGENTIILNKELMEAIVQQYLETQLFRDGTSPVVQSITPYSSDMPVIFTEYRVKTFGSKMQFVEQLAGRAKDKPEL